LTNDERPTTLSAQEQRRADAHLGASPDANFNTVLTASLDLVAALAALGRTLLL
jgi:hypothetical protein